MNLKITGALIVIAIIIGAVVYINPFKPEAETTVQSPWFYQIAEDDIETIKVNYRGTTVSFHKTSKQTWAFDDPEGIPPFFRRWGGITLLLSGPGTKRDLTSARPLIDDPAQYGLDDPDTIVDVGLTSNRSIQFRLGDLTTDGQHNYSQVIGFPDLFLITSTWVDVISRIAYDPPIPMWFVQRHPSTISELNIHYGNPALKETHRISFVQNQGQPGWQVQDFDTDPSLRPIDEDRWNEFSSRVSRADEISVAVPWVADRDYSPWGITENSTAIEIRFTGKTDSGTTFTDGVLLLLGDKTEDEQFYYAKNQTTYSIQPVLQLNADWVDTVLEFGNDIPYGD